MEDKKYIRFQLIAVAIGVLLMAIKFWAFYITNSNTIFSDAMESIVNIAAGSFALYSLILAAKPKDRDHPYGHGKIEFISAGIEGTLILIAGSGIVYKAIEGLITQQQITHLDVGMYLAGAAGLVNYGLGSLTTAYGKKNGSPTMVASGKHLQTDGYTSAGMILGLFVVLWTSLNWIDSAMALGFGSFLGYVGVREIRKSYAGIMDEADFKLLRKLISEIDKNRNENWIDLHNFRTQKFGKHVHIDCHVTLPHYLTVQQAHDEIDRMENLVKAQHPAGVEMFIHADPCIPASCRICRQNACNVRQVPFEERITWQLENVTKNSKHQ